MWIGVTGGIATGKSTVSNYLKSKGYPVIDADLISHRLTQKGELAYAPILQVFGPAILGLDEQIDRKKLGSIVFKDPSKKLLLESILHPLIQSEVAYQKKKYEDLGHKLVFYDVPLLFEKNLNNQFDAVVLVYSDEGLQRERLKTRNLLSDSEIDARLGAQLPIEQKVKQADYIIDNTGSLEQIRVEVDLFLKKVDSGLN